MGQISNKRYKKLLVTIYRAKTNAISKFALLNSKVWSVSWKGAKLSSVTDTTKSWLQIIFKFKGKFLSQGDLPVQVFPSPLYPLKQRHTYDPSVLVHRALESQSCKSSVAHSSTSTQNRGNKKPSLSHNYRKFAGEVYKGTIWCWIGEEGGVEWITKIGHCKKAEQCFKR